MSPCESAVICLGELLVDQVVDEYGRRQDFPGGAPANVAVGLARLGVPVAFVGAVGQDSQGRHLTRVLQSQQVDCRGVQVCNAPTRIVEVTCTEDGDRQFGGFVGGTHLTFADTQLTAQGLPTDSWSAAQVLVTGTLGWAYPATREAMSTAAEKVQSQGGKLIIDVNWRPMFWPEPSAAEAMLRPWLQRADLIKVSVDDAIALFDTSDLAQLKARWPQAHIFLTGGDRGCRYTFAADQGQVPAFSVPVVETTGAGDAFLAGLIYQCIQQHWQFATAAQLARAVQFANAMGALTTLKPGAIAALPTVAELLDFLHTRTGEIWTIGGV